VRTRAGRDVNAFVWQGQGNKSRLTISIRMS
jgi:hypothetical protein